MLLRLKEATGCSTPSITSPAGDKTTVASADRFHFDVAASWLYTLYCLTNVNVIATAHGSRCCMVHTHTWNPLRSRALDAGRVL